MSSFFGPDVVTASSFPVGVSSLQRGRMSDEIGILADLAAGRKIADTAPARRIGDAPCPKI
jgi:hypothetical protein